MNTKHPSFPNLSWLGVLRFRDCERRWYNAHAVNKIEDGRTEHHWSLIREGKLAPWNTIVGFAVDKAITEALRGHNAGEPWPSDLPQVAADHVDGYVNFSRHWAHAVQNRQKWPRSGYQPLDRIFYGSEPKPSEMNELRDKARRLTKTFDDGEVKQFLMEQDPATFVAPRAVDEGIPWTTIKGVPTYTNYDFIVRTEERVTIFDWKTGKVSKNADKKAMKQLHLYALYVMEEWGVPKANITLVPVWLSMTGGLHRFPVDRPTLDAVITDLRQIYRTINSRMAKHGANIVAMEKEFPLTEDLGECRRCLFRSCEGYKRYEAMLDQGDLFARE